MIIWNQFGRRSCVVIMEEKHPCHTKLCAFRCLISGHQNLIMRSRNQVQIFYWKITYFSKTTSREPFLIVFYTINWALHCLLPSKFLCLQLFWIKPIVSTGFNWMPAIKITYCRFRSSCSLKLNSLYTNEYSAGWICSHKSL